MIREIPVLVPEATIEEARTRIHPQHNELSPTFDDEGPSIGDFTLRAFTTSRPWESSQHATRSEPRVIDANDPDSVLQDARPNMAVLINDGTRVGVVDRVGRDERGRRNSVVVVYGRLAKRRKVVEGRLVDLVDDGDVMLSIDSVAFKALPDD